MTQCQRKVLKSDRNIVKSDRNLIFCHASKITFLPSIPVTGIRSLNYLSLVAVSYIVHPPLYCLLSYSAVWLVVLRIFKLDLS